MHYTGLNIDNNNNNVCKLQISENTQIKIPPRHSTTAAVKSRPITTVDIIYYRCYENVQMSSNG